MTSPSKRRGNLVVGNSALLLPLIAFCIFPQPFQPQQTYGFDRYSQIKQEIETRGRLQSAPVFTRFHNCFWKAVEKAKGYPTWIRTMNTAKHL